MQKFLMDFFSTAGAVVLNKKTKVPDSKVERGETVVGVLPDELKRLYVALQEAGDALKEGCEPVHDVMEAILDKSIFDISDADKDVLRQHTLAHNQYELLSDVFWASVDKEFPQLVFPPVGRGVREGWQVVSTPRKEPQVHIIDLGMMPFPNGLLDALRERLGR